MGEDAVGAEHPVPLFGIESMISSRRTLLVSSKASCIAIAALAWASSSDLLVLALPQPVMKTPIPLRP
ncbi:MAG: hypothetical protein R2709_15560 [Marmoricola sp.]